MLKETPFVNRSKIRSEILKSLEKAKTPTQLSKILNLHRSAISRAILELEEKDIIRCLSPAEKRGRFYQINKKGKEILEEIESLN